MARGDWLGPRLAATSTGTTFASSSRSAQEDSSSSPMRLRTASPGKRSTDASRRWCVASPGRPPSIHTARPGSRTSTESSAWKKRSSTLSTVTGPGDRRSARGDDALHLRLAPLQPRHHRVDDALLEHPQRLIVVLEDEPARRILARHLQEGLTHPHGEPRPRQPLAALAVRAAAVLLLAQPLAQPRQVRLHVHEHHQIWPDALRGHGARGLQLPHGQAAPAAAERELRVQVAVADAHLAASQAGAITSSSCCASRATLRKNSVRAPISNRWESRVSSRMRRAMGAFSSPPSRACATL